MTIPSIDLPPLDYIVIIAFVFEVIQVMMIPMRRLLPFALLILAFVFAGTASAQTATPTPPPIREIYLVLGLGDPVFEPEAWLASAAEREDRTTATWLSSELGALGYAEYLHFNGGYEPESLVNFFDDTWFAVSFKEYTGWERTARCAIGDTLVYEFSLTKADQPYLMRYWVQPVTPTRVLALHMVFPADRADELERYSQVYAPLAWECPR